MKRRHCCNDYTVTTSNDISLSLTLFLSPNVRSIPYIPHFLFVFIGTFPLCLSFPPLLPALHLPAKTGIFDAQQNTGSPFSPHALPPLPVVRPPSGTKNTAGSGAAPREPSVYPGAERVKEVDEVKVTCTVAFTLLTLCSEVFRGLWRGGKMEGILGLVTLFVRDIFFSSSQCDAKLSLALCTCGELHELI